MRMRWLAILLLTLTACGAETWTKPGGTETEWQQDLYACQVDASHIPPTPDNPWIQVGQKERLLTACLTAKGYRRTK